MMYAFSYPFLFSWDEIGGQRRHKRVEDHAGKCVKCVGVMISMTKLI